MIDVRVVASGPCVITGAAQDPPCDRVAAPMAGESRDVNLACLGSGERIPP